MADESVAFMEEQTLRAMLEDAQPNVIYRSLGDEAASRYEIRIRLLGNHPS